MRDYQQLENRIRRSVVSATVDLGIKASFAEGRRDSDIMVVRLRGKRKDSIFITNQLKEIFPSVDIDILQGKKHDGDVVTLIITAPVNEQESQESMERRSKMRHLAKRNTKKADKQASNVPSSKVNAKDAHDEAMSRMNSGQIVPNDQIPDDENVGYDYRKIVN